MNKSVAIKAGIFLKRFVVCAAMILLMTASAGSFQQDENDSKLIIQKDDSLTGIKTLFPEVVFESPDWEDPPVSLVYEKIGQIFDDIGISLITDDKAAADAILRVVLSCSPSEQRYSTFPGSNDSTSHYSGASVNGYVSLVINETNVLKTHSWAGVKPPELITSSYPERKDAPFREALDKYLPVLEGELNFVIDRIHDIPHQMWKLTTGEIELTDHVVADGTLYVGSEDGYLYAIDTGDGRLKWQYKLGEDIDESPAVSDGIVFVGSSDDSIHAVNAEDGSLKWKVKYSDYGYLNYSPLVADGIVILNYTGRYSDYLLALYIEDGTSKWEIKSEDDMTMPAISDNILCYGSDDEYIYAVNVDNGERLWRFNAESEINNPPVVSDGIVYVITGYSIQALNIDDGKHRWKMKTGDDIGSQPIVVDGIVYVCSEDDYLYALNASNGIMKWKYEVGYAYLSVPAASNGVLYVSPEYADCLYAFDMAKSITSYEGVLKWKFEVMDDITSSPVIYDGAVYVSSQDRNLYSLNADDGTLNWKYQIYSCRGMKLGMGGELFVSSFEYPEEGNYNKGYHYIYALKENPAGQ